MHSRLVVVCLVPLVGSFVISISWLVVLLLDLAVFWHALSSVERHIDVAGEMRCAWYCDHTDCLGDAGRCAATVAHQHATVGGVTAWWLRWFCGVCATVWVGVVSRSMCTQYNNICTISVWVAVVSRSMCTQYNNICTIYVRVCVFCVSWAVIFYGSRDTPRV